MTTCWIEAICNYYKYCTSFHFYFLCIKYETAGILRYCQTLTHSASDTESSVALKYAEAH